MITRKELIKKYFDFFKSNNHKEISNSSLIPENDPTVLFTTAGMHPLVPFLLGQKHPQGKRLVGIQKCIRTGDIEEVGDETHHTFFEMLGNWSLGDYWKKEAIQYSFEFLTEVLKIQSKKISVTCFKGDEKLKIPKDEETAKIWEDVGIKKENIKFLGKKDNWWGPAGKIGPCGPDTEMFVNETEIWNDVLMQYEKDSNGNFKEAKQKNIDTGMGVERTLSILNNFNDNYLTEIWQPLIKDIEKLSNRKYEENKKEMRIIADHLKAAVFILNEKITPSNKEHGYVLRRLIRRSIRYGNLIGIKNFLKELSKTVFKIYKLDYKFDERTIMQELEKEEKKFNLTLEKGLNKFQKFSQEKKEISGGESFLLYQSFGFPIEMIEEESKKAGIKFSIKEFEKEQQKHQELSKTATKGKFKSGLADDSEKTTKLHTATHLLLVALKKVLNDEKIQQKGSNINPERLRLDFNFSRKLTDEEIKKIEYLVNEQINKELPIKREEMHLEEAKEQGAEGIFESKYSGKISVYTIGNFSKEICTGPHVKNTKEIGNFKIIKEESSGSGTRRIKAIVE